MIALLLALLSPAHAWTTTEKADIKVDQTVEIDAAALYAGLSDFKNWEVLFTDDCAREWIHGTESTGPNARSRVTYTIAGMKRRLTAVFDKTEPMIQEVVVKDETGKVLEVKKETIGYLVEVDHEGKKGFITRWRLENKDDAKVRIRFETYMNPPPWPLRKYYFTKVKPAWTKCYEEAMTRLPQVAG